MNLEVYGEAGNDTFYGGAGNDAFDGGDGIDTADYGRVLTGVNVSLATFASTDGLGGAIHS